jgi:hypothetical protein
MPPIKTPKGWSISEKKFTILAADYHRKMLSPKKMLRPLSGVYKISKPSKRRKKILQNASFKFGSYSSSGELRIKIFSKVFMKNCRRKFYQVPESDNIKSKLGGNTVMNKSDSEKIQWQGTIISVQPRTNVWRYRTDNRTHYYKGYNIFLEGEINGSPGRFAVAISEVQQQTLVFRIGDQAKGTAWTKKNSESDYADFYRAGGLIITKKAELIPPDPPPYLIEPPDLDTYKQRGPRMLSATSYDGKCFQCAFANMAAVEIEYNWGKTKKHRFESFCYGPFSCKLYKRGRPRGVPYKGDGTSYDTGFLDEVLTENRDEDKWEDALIEAAMDRKFEDHKRRET